jgi:hypothetical protein
MLLAVGPVAGEPTAVGGDEIVGAFLGPPHPGKPVEGERELQTEGDRQGSIDRARSPPSAPGMAGSVAGLDHPGGAFALLHAETG